jgi:transposase
VRRREGRYLLRTNLTQAFKELKSGLAVRPIYHQTDARIEAHIFVAFLAYCLQLTLKQRLRALAPGLTPRAVIEQTLLLHQLQLKLPGQPPPRIQASASAKTA